MGRGRYLRRKIANALQSVLLLGIMVVIFGLIGKLIAGLEGVAVAVIAGVVVFLLSPRISPAMVLRMYQARRLAPEEFPVLYRIMEGLSDKANLPEVPKIYYIPSGIMNAFSVGRRDQAVIAVTDGLVRGLDSQELTGILAHEVSHIEHNDLWIMGLADFISRFTNVFSIMGVLFLLLYFPAILLGWINFSLWAVLIIIFAPYATVLLQLALSRIREYEADMNAVRLTGDPEGLASALGKIEHYPIRLWNLILIPGKKAPTPSLLRTHPHTEKRIARLMDMAGKKV